MKNILFIFLFVPSILLAQQNELSIKYNIAYKYLNCRNNLKAMDNVLKKLPDNGFSVNVIPEIYPISLMFLNKDIIRSEIMPDSLQGENIGIFISSFDEKNYFTPYINKNLLNNFPNNDKSQIYIVFSKPKKNFLLANIYIDYYNNKPKKVSDIPKFGPYYKLLFIFNNKNKLIHCYSNKVNQ